MKFTLKWLKDHLQTDATLDQITHTLTAIGLEVEEVVNPADEFAPFVVAEVIEAKPHPDADRLRVCTVNTGSGDPVQVVCGAPNARTGLKGIFAPPGAYVPGIDLTLQKSKIRGVESHGMLCSEREMQLSEEHDGIIDLPADAPVGLAYVDYFDLDDPVIEIAITPNRQDCLGVAGIARDLAAAGLGTVKTPALPTIQGQEDCPISIDLRFNPDQADACPHFAGVVVRGVKNGPSPAWMRQRLTAIGLRPISSLVDMTNYISYDRGRPLHVYDMAKLTGGIHARLAKVGEKLAALDGKTYELTGAECVIADDAGVLGLGGVIGGEASGCSDETTDVLIECAYFDPIRTAMTGRHHGINSDARYRFERGVDPAFVDDGLTLATGMLLDLCGGTASRPTCAGGPIDWHKTVAFRPDRVASLGGLDVSNAEIEAILDRLGFGVTADSDTLQVAVPSWRRDVDGEADLVEEVLRIKGYDAIAPVDLPRTKAVARPTLTVGQKRARAVRRRLASIGFFEAVTYSFMDADRARLFAQNDELIALENPIASDLSVMRPSILPNLIDAAQRNRDRGEDGASLFEVGPQYHGDTPKDQALVAAGVRAGYANARSWQGPVVALDAFTAKADALAALDASGAPADKLMSFADAGGVYHPGRSGTLRLGPKNVLARFGELHPALMHSLDVGGPIVAFEVYLDAIPQSRKGSGTSRAAFTVSNLPAVERDFAFLVDQDLAAADLLRAAAGADKTHIVNVSLFDVFQGQGIAEGQKSLAITVRLQPVEATFSEAQIEAISAKIVAAVAKATGAQLRS